MSLHPVKPYGPATRLLCMYPKELKTGIQTKTFAQMLMAEPVIIVKGENNPNVCQLLNG